MGNSSLDKDFLPNKAMGTWVPAQPFPLEYNPNLSSTWGLYPFSSIPNLVVAKPVDRKLMPVCTGVLDYFPLALLEISKCSKICNDQHNPGQELHWDKTKSTDHADSLVRHLLDRGTFDTDGVRHSAKVAWRALALLETEIEKENGK